MPSWEETAGKVNMVEDSPYCTDWRLCNLYPMFLLGILFTVSVLTSLEVHTLGPGGSRSLSSSILVLLSNPTTDYIFLRKPSLTPYYRILLSIPLMATIFIVGTMRIRALFHSFTWLPLLPGTLTLMSGTHGSSTFQNIHSLSKWL